MKWVSEDLIAVTSLFAPAERVYQITAARTCSVMQKQAEQTPSHLTVGSWRETTQNSTSHDSEFLSNLSGLPFIHSVLLRHWRHSSHFSFYLFYPRSVLAAWSGHRIFGSCSLRQSFFILSQKSSVNVVFKSKLPRCVSNLVFCIFWPHFYIWVVLNQRKRKMLFTCIDSQGWDWAGMVWKSPGGSDVISWILVSFWVLEDFPETLMVMHSVHMKPD